MNFWERDGGTEEEKEGMKDRLWMRMGVLELKMDGDIPGILPPPPHDDEEEEEHDEDDFDLGL